MQFGKRPAFAFLFFSVLFPVANVSATTVTWSTYASWKTNVLSPIELNFAGISPVTGSYNNSTGKTLYPASGPALPFIFTGPYTGGYQLTSGQYGTSHSTSFFGPTATGGNITITLPTGGENAFLLGLGSVSSSTVTVALSDGQSFSVAGTANAYEFLGLSISHAVSWVTISSPGQPVVNDFFFGSSQLTQDSVPVTPPAAVEGSTFCLIAGGILSMFGFRRKLFPPQAAA